MVGGFLSMVKNNRDCSGGSFSEKGPRPKLFPVDLPLPLLPEVLLNCKNGSSLSRSSCSTKKYPNVC